VYVRTNPRQRLVRPPCAHGTREARARREAEEFEQLAGDYLFSAGGGGLQSEWSDGFRAVRSLKYGTDENFSDLYKKVMFVGGLQEAALPEAVRAFLRESRDERGGQQRRGRASGGGGGRGGMDGLGGHGGGSDEDGAPGGVRDGGDDDDA
jgi:hypothetical protein